MRSPLKICKRPLNSLKRFGSNFIHREEGQMAPMMMTALLIGYSTFMGAAIDMGNLLWHKNHATTAANAACMAGAADLVWVTNQGTGSAVGNYEASPTGFQLAVNTTGSAAPAGSSISGNCASASSSVAMCAYAEANGYNPGVSGNNVSWTVSNVLPPQQTINSSGSGSVGSFTTQQNATQMTTPNGVLPFLHVSVTEQVPTYLLSIMPWFKSPVSVTGYCNCGLSSGGAVTSQEQTLTAQCPIGDAVYSGDWESVTPNQMRLTGDTGNNWDPVDWVNYQCGGNWTDSQGVSQPRNYLTTIPGATIDGVEASINATSDYDWTYYPVFTHVELIANNDTGFTVGVRTALPPNAIPGEPYITTDSFILYQKPDPIWPYNTFGSANSTWQGWGANGQATSMWGISQANMMNAVSNEMYFGFAVAVQGAGERVFIGNGTSGQPYITVYYHTSRYYATMF